MLQHVHNYFCHRFMALILIIARFLLNEIQSRLFTPLMHVKRYVLILKCLHICKPGLSTPIDMT